MYVGVADSEIESLDGEYTAPFKVPIDTELSIGDTGAMDDGCDTKELIAQLSGDIGDSEALRANGQNFIARNVRNYVFATHHNVLYLARGRN